MTVLPVRRCAMPECGQPMQAREVFPAAKGAQRVAAYRCLLCDVRKCKCEHRVQSPHAKLCPSCGRDLFKDPA